jgi:hypothetical protein
MRPEMNDMPSNENYEIDNPEVKTILRSIGSKIGAAVKPGWGFALFIYEYGGPNGANFYIASADRSDIIRMLEEWIARQRRDMQPEGVVRA